MAISTAELRQLRLQSAEDLQVAALEHRIDMLILRHCRLGEPLEIDTTRETPQVVARVIKLYDKAGWGFQLRRGFKTLVLFDTKY